jgi:hypothetical protein
VARSAARLRHCRAAAVCTRSIPLPQPSPDVVCVPPCLCAPTCSWVESEDDQGSPQNVQFFRRLLEEACSLAHKNSPLAWLARQPLEPLMRSPFRLQGDMCR